MTYPELQAAVRRYREPLWDNANDHEASVWMFRVNEARQVICNALLDQTPLSKEVLERVGFVDRYADGRISCRSWMSMTVGDFEIVVRPMQVNESREWVGVEREVFAMRYGKGDRRRFWPAIESVGSLLRLLIGLEEGQ